MAPRGGGSYSPAAAPRTLARLRVLAPQVPAMAPKAVAARGRNRASIRRPPLAELVDSCLFDLQMTPKDIGRLADSVFGDKLSGHRRENVVILFERVPPPFVELALHCK